MNSLLPTVLCRRAFSLLELLVVLSIIAILAGLLLPVTNPVMNNARKVQAKNIEVQIVTAIRSFQTDYGVYPMPVDASTNADVCFGANAPTQAELFHILRADKQANEASINTRAIVYIELPNAKNMTLAQAKKTVSLRTGCCMTHGERSTLLASTETTMIP